MNSTPRWFIPVLLGLQAAFVASTFDTWTVCLLFMGVFAAVAALHDRWMQRRVARQRIFGSLRWIGNAALYFFIASVIFAWRFGDYAGEAINPVAFAFDGIAHTALVSGLLLWARHPVFGHPAMLGLGLLVVLLCVAAGGTSHSMASQIAVALATTIGFVFSSNFILGHRHRRKLGVPRGREAAVIRTSGIQHEPVIADAGGLGILFSLLVLSVILMTSTAIAHVTEYMLPSIQNTLHKQLTNSLEAVHDQAIIGSTRYVRGTRIGSIRKHLLGNPTSIALRAYADSSPGYLRGTVLDKYANGRWSSISNEGLPIQMESHAIRPRELLPAGQALTRLRGYASRPLRRFFLHQADDQPVLPIEIHNDPLKGAVVFTPLATRWVEASSHEITVSHHDVVQAGVNVANPYVCGVAEETNREIIDTQRRSLLLRVPANLRDQTSKLSSSLCASHPTAVAKADAVSEYFRANFQYSLNYEVHQRLVDPISHFLTVKHAAHCEYFATATVLLLRSAGIPARYVTGYVASEYSDKGSCWIARNRDAHAWAEAYDSITERWFPVESTPGRTYRSPSGSRTNDFYAGASGGRLDEQFFEDSLLNILWGRLTSIRATDLLTVIFRFGQLPLFFALVFWLCKSVRRGYDTESDAADIKSKQMLQRLDRKLKKLSLIRRRHETLHQFAARIEDALNDSANPERHREFLEQAAHWYREYAAARYRGQMPTPFQQLTAA